MAGENEAQVQGDWPNRHSLHGPLDGGEVDRHRNWKRLGNYSAQAGTAGNVAAQGALHTGGIALVTGAVSATGIGLVVAGGALTLGNMAKGARSWRKTSKHLRGLSEIYRHGHEY